MKSSSKLCRKSLCTSIVAMLLIISVMVPMVAEVAEAEINTTGTYFWVDPKDNIVEPYCTVFPVNIMIENADETWAWETTLNFDNNTLGVMSVTEGPWLSESDAKDTLFFTTSWVKANETGTISIGCTLRGDVPGTSGSGLLCTINFHVESCGRSPLDLQDTALLDMDLVRTEYPNNDGFFCATCSLDCLHDVAIVDVRVNVTEIVDQGAIIEVNVTIHNEGSHNQTVIVRAYAEKITHNPLDPDEVLVGDDILIGEEPGVYIEPCNYISIYFVWNTTTVPGEVYTICAEVIKPEDDDPHDNVFIGPVVRVVCPHDLKVTDVEVLTPKVHNCSDIFVDVSVVNEGKNTEIFNITVYANGSLVYTSPNIQLVVDESTTLTCKWHENKTGIYVISAKAGPVAGEKDTADNEKEDGTVTVIHDDVGVVAIALNPPCGYQINVTIKNTGTDDALVTIYVWADPTPGDFNANQTPPSPDALLIGWAPRISIGAGTNITIIGLDPYAGIPFGETLPTLFPPGTPLTACTAYTIFAIVEKLSDTDDDASNDWLQAASTVKARLPGDVDSSGTVGSIDLGKLGSAYGSMAGQPTYNFQADFDASGTVGSIDLGKLGANYGGWCP